MEKPRIIRSRNGCHKCKRMKTKCDELKPLCSNCLRTQSTCDYSLKLTWGGRPYKDKNKRVKTSAFETPNLQNKVHGSALILLQNPSSPSKFDSSILTPRSLDLICALPKTVAAQPFPSSIGQTGSTPPSNPLYYQTPASQSTQLGCNSSTITSPVGYASDTLSLFSGAIQKAREFSAHSEARSDQFPSKTACASLFDQMGDCISDYTTEYSIDLEKIQLCMPEQSPNLEFYTASSLFRQSNRPRFEDINDLQELPPATCTCADHAGTCLVFCGLHSEDYRSQEPAPPPITYMAPPLPTMLLEVPYYRGLLHFWVNVVAHNLVPAPSHLYMENPFKVILPQMALSCPSVLAALLAFAAEFKFMLSTHVPDTSAIIDQLLKRSCNELLRLLKNTESATADHTLATIMLLACFDLFSSGDFHRHRIHTLGARQIIEARGRNALTKHQGDTSREVTSFLVRWFVYIDVIGALSATKNQENYLTSSELYLDRPSKSPEDANTSNLYFESLHNEKSDIDEMLGFEVNLVPQFTKIALLIRKTEAQLDFCRVSGLQPNVSPDIVGEALIVKENIICAYEAGEALRRERLHASLQNSHQKPAATDVLRLLRQDAVLRSTNKMFCDMGVINLYRRVLRVRRDSELVQKLAAGVARLAHEHIEVRSPADICTIFPLFTAGCETLDSELQQFFTQRFTNLVEMGNINAQKGLAIMQRCWNTGQEWIDALKDLDIDLTLL